MSKIILTGYIDVPDRDLAEVKQALPYHLELTQQEAGCLVFNVEQDKTNRHIFHVYEEFVDKAAFEAHQKRVQSSDWGTLTKHIARHYKITEE